MLTIMKLFTILQSGGRHAMPCKVIGTGTGERMGRRDEKENWKRD